MIWIRRLLFLPGWLLLAATLSFFAGYESLPGLSYESGLILAAGGGIALFILLRFFAVAALSLSLGFGLALLIAVAVLANFFLFERERDRWINLETELAQQIPAEQRDQAFMRSLGITPSDSPPLNWWAHTQAQVNSGLKSQQLTANQIGVPKPVRSAEEIWFNWLGQFMMFFTGVMAAILFGRRRK